MRLAPASFSPPEQPTASPSNRENDLYNTRKGLTLNPVFFRHARCLLAATFLVVIAEFAAGGELGKSPNRDRSSRATQSVQAADPNAKSLAALGTEYAHAIRPLLTQYCLKCHSTAKQTGDLDLERFSKLDDVRKATKVWLKVAEMLDNGEMPPQDAKQPNSTERKHLRGWIDRYLHAEALAGAGDPGPVVLRRLSNAEYTYTVRDLTKVDLNPARDFPTDGAAGEGFTNTGNALVMSPALLTKYFDAGARSPSMPSLCPMGFASRRRIPAATGPTTCFRKFALCIANTPTRPADRGSTCKASSLTPTTAAGCRSNATWPPRST